MTEKYICIHGHFYQPPRENPWLEDIEFQDSAYPYHDWNERINAECYAPNTASRVVDGEGKVVVIGNNYARISFNMGPTLLSWMQSHAQETYASILEADKLSAQRFSGHGSALAQAYNHMIMPLANARDKRTQVLWGIRDFQNRYGRPPEGMWLPETAVDLESLDIMAEQGIRFTILSPFQAKAARRRDSGEWQDTSGGRIDHRTAYLCCLPSGRTITLFFYDGQISRDIAFGGLLKRGEDFAARMLSVFSDGPAQLSHVATDGETYGHHQKFGDMALCYCLNAIDSDSGARLTNYGEYLEKFPPLYEARIFENTSWSCAHGVERWRSDCGCNTGMHGDWKQHWRKPLRDSMDWLRDTLSNIYESEMGKYCVDPWLARDNYIGVVLDRSEKNMRAFTNQCAGRDLSHGEALRLIKLLEMQRNAMLMYTSCGWFFDEVSGLETVQVLQYAYMALRYGEELSGRRLEGAYLALLEKIPTNIPDFVNGAHIFNTFVKPAVIDFLRLGAHYAITALFDDYPEHVDMYNHHAETDIYEKRTSDGFKLFVCRARLTSLTTREQMRFSSAVLHLGGHSIFGGIRSHVDDATSVKMRTAVGEVFDKNDIPQTIAVIKSEFPEYTYSLGSLFKDQKKKVLDKIVQPILEDFNNYLHRFCDGNCDVLDVYQQQGLPIPRGMAHIVGYSMNADIALLFDGSIDVEQLDRITERVRRLGLSVDTDMISRLASDWINKNTAQLGTGTADIRLLAELEKTVELLGSIGVPLNLWKSQNIYYSILLKHKEAMKMSAGAQSDWFEAFRKLGLQLKIRA